MRWRSKRSSGARQASSDPVILSATPGYLGAADPEPAPDPAARTEPFVLFPAPAPPLPDAVMAAREAIIGQTDAQAALDDVLSRLVAYKRAIAGAGPQVFAIPGCAGSDAPIPEPFAEAIKIRELEELNARLEGTNAAVRIALAEVVASFKLPVLPEQRPEPAPAGPVPGTGSGAAPEETASPSGQDRVPGPGGEAAGAIPARPGPDAGEADGRPTFEAAA